MTFVDAYDPATGKKLPYRVPEAHIDHPLLGQRLRRLPSDGRVPARGDVPDAPAGSLEEAHLLKGDALDAALEDAALPKTGSADEKRARLVGHRTSQVVDLTKPPGNDPVPTDSNTGDPQTPAAGENEE